MVETGATTADFRLRAGSSSNSLESLTSPLLPDDYFALINPRWSTRELTGRVVRVRHETDDATTIVIKPDFDWPGHQPGQYLRIGMEINGIRHWRAYTITSDPNHHEGVVSVTVKHTEGGKMSPGFPALRAAGTGRVPRRGRGRVPAARPGAGQAAVRVGRQRHHADLEHAARARTARGARRLRARPQLPHRRGLHLRTDAAPDGPAPGRLQPARDPHRRSSRASRPSSSTRSARTGASARSSCPARAT